MEGMQESETGKAVKEREENERRIRRSKTFDIFGAEMKTVVECLNCSHKSETAERYYDLNIVRLPFKLGMSEVQQPP